MEKLSENYTVVKGALKISEKEKNINEDKLLEYVRAIQSAVANT